MSALRRISMLSSVRAIPSTAVPRRLYHHTSELQRPYKDDQEREFLKPRSGEHTKSAADDDMAAHDDAAFIPNVTRPEKEKKLAAKGNRGSPLEVSGANQHISKPQGDNPEGAVDAKDKKRRSAAGSTPKGGSKDTE